MAVMDFRDGGHVFSRGDKRREFSYRNSDDDGSGSDEARFAADPGSEGLSVRLARLTHYLGALVSVALMVGLMVWGWQLVMRDVSGIPVIKAVAGEARTTPDDPGGELTGHTGFAVNDVSGGAEAGQVDQVGIAPAATPLDESDVAMGNLGATARQPASEADQPLDFDGEAVIAMQDSEAAAARAAAEAEAQAAAELARMQAMAAAAEAESQVAAAEMADAPAADGPVNEMVTDENAEPAQADAINDALAQAQVTAQPAVLASSTRPAPRPRRAAAAVAAAAAPAAAPVETAAAPEAAPAAAAPARRPEAALAAAEAEAQQAAPSQSARVSSGAPLVQIGAFDSDALAAGEFGRVSGKFGNLFAGKGQVIQKHEVNGRTFWRLRVAGFDSRADAQAFCAELKAAGTDCIPATAQ